MHRPNTSSISFALSVSARSCQAECRRDLDTQQPLLRPVPGGSTRQSSYAIDVWQVSDKRFSRQMEATEPGARNTRACHSRCDSPSERKRGLLVLLASQLNGGGTRPEEGVKQKVIGAACRCAYKFIGTSALPCLVVCGRIERKLVFVQALFNGNVVVVRSMEEGSPAPIRQFWCGKRSVRF
jgi:hypothetical protein